MQSASREQGRKGGGGRRRGAALDPAEQKALLELHAWFDDWSTVARHHITRRRYLIALGLVSPRKGKKGKKGEKGEVDGVEKEPT